jgi:CRP-like cAMP-binding protein
MLAPTPAPTARRSLLDIDPELGARLGATRFNLARSALRVPVILCDRTGGWLGRADPVGPGLLLVDGVLSRALLSDGEVVSAELLGPGDLVRARCDSGEDPLELLERYEPLGRVVAAVLDVNTALRLTRWPEIGAALLDRACERAHRLAVTQAIAALTGVDRRLHALLWHLAGRFGRVTSEGVTMPLALSHRRLGELVGARRPTVSTAMARLLEAGLLARREAGGWLLTGEPPQRLAADALANPA